MTGVVARWVSCYFALGLVGKFTNKERAFMAFAWIPKATVQAALSA